MHMKQDNLIRLRRSIAISYVFMFLALFTVIGGAFAYWYARKSRKQRMPKYGYKPKLYGLCEMWLFILF